MHSKKKSKKDIDPTTQKLIEKGLINVDSGKKKKSTKQKVKDFGEVTYDFWSGVKYTLVLSGLLWWLPLFGPMLAGYVGGRRTGGPKKGLIASILALGLIGGVQYALMHGVFPSNVMSVMSVPSAALTAAYQKPVLAPYAEFLHLYWGSFFTKVIGGLPYSPNSYLITIIFAYVGGVVSVEKKRELSEAEGLNSQININLAGLLSRSSHTKSRASRAAGSRKSSLVRSNFGNHTSGKANFSSSKRRLEDLKAIQFKRNGGSKKKKKTKKKSSAGKQAQPSHSRNFTKRPVQHHSNTEGDDWEIL